MARANFAIKDTGNSKPRTRKSLDSKDQEVLRSFGGQAFWTLWTQAADGGGAAGAACSTCHVRSRGENEEWI